MARSSIDPMPTITAVESASEYPFSVSFRRDGINLVVAVVGELDVATAPRLEGVLRCLCAPVDGELRIDAAEMTFCDCSGLSVLLRAAHRRLQRGHHLTVAHPTPEVRRLIGLAQVADWLFITDQPT